MDIVKNNPGIYVNKLTEHFDFSRYAVMKHMSNCVKLPETVSNADLFLRYEANCQMT